MYTLLHYKEGFIEDSMTFYVETELVEYINYLYKLDNSITLKIRIDNIQQEDIKLCENDDYKQEIKWLYNMYDEDELIERGMDIENVKMCFCKLGMEGELK
jgi:hypothetical protein